MPLAIQVFDSDKQALLATLPLTCLVSRYQEAIDSFPELLAKDRADLDVSHDPADVERESEVNRAALIAAVNRMGRTEVYNGDAAADAFRLILAEVLAHPAIREDFRYMATAHIIQFAMPASPKHEPEVQWRKVDDACREELTEAVGDDLEVLQAWVQQADENIAYLEGIISDNNRRAIALRKSAS